MSRSEYKTKKQWRKYGSFLKDRAEKKKKIDLIRGIVKSDKYYLAKDIIDEYIEKYGEDNYINHELAKYYARLNESDKARSIFQANIDDCSQTMYYSMYELAKMERGCANFERAEELLNQIIVSPHESKEHALLELAKVYIDTRRYDEAKELLDKIINEDMPNKMLAYQPYIEILIYIGDYEKAKEYIELIKDIIPKMDRIYYEAYISWCERKYITAERILKSNDLGIGKTRLLFCNIEYSLRKFDSVIESIDPVIRFNNNSDKKEGIILLAKSYAKEGRFEEALETINRLNEFKKVDTELMNYLTGSVYYEMNDYYSARSYFGNIENIKGHNYLMAIMKEISMLIGEERYADAYNILNCFKYDLIKDNKKTFYSLSKLFLEQQLNIPNTKEPGNYSELQMISFDKEIAIDHIKKHCYYVNDETAHTLFNENIDIDELYDYVTDTIDDDNLWRKDMFDVYIIPYKNASAASEEKCNHIRVITLHNTKNIITMYPISTYVEANKVLTKERK